MISALQKKLQFFSTSFMHLNVVVPWKIWILVSINTDELKSAYNRMNINARL